MNQLFDLADLNTRRLGGFGQGITIIIECFGAFSNVILGKFQRRDGPRELKEEAGITTGLLQSQVQVRDAFEGVPLAAHADEGRFVPEGSDTHIAGHDGCLLVGPGTKVDDTVTVKNIMGRRKRTHSLFPEGFKPVPEPSQNVTIKGIQLLYSHGIAEKAAENGEFFISTEA
jgi:hypothetical protein